MASVSFELVFKMDNFAFQPYPENEIIRILDEVKINMEDGKTSGKVMDINGNSIGHYKIKGIKS